LAPIVLKDVTIDITIWSSIKNTARRASLRPREKLGREAGTAGE
jgi:hypothetical protein